MNVLITLHKDRTIPGVLTCGEFSAACLGLSDKRAAIAHNNADRDPAKPFGNVPAGDYTGKLVVAGDNLRSFGPNQRILLTPKDPAIAHSRWGLMIHGGDPSASGGFRPTHGCVRVSNAAAGRLQMILPQGETFDVEIREV